ncbi:hypothetical protein [Actinoplanes sp. NPDC020271]|uniref:hypothetical protein n=1 Tax=Actinoplanes sp. NPDC020271 TaxID=3363896 RepID=UPI0037A15C46
MNTFLLDLLNSQPLLPICRLMTARYPWARTLAALAGIAALLGLLVVVTNQLTERRIGDDDTDLSGSMYDSIPFDQEAFRDYFRTHSPFLEPVPIGEAVTMTGDPGFVAELRADRAYSASTASYTLRIKNVGTESFDGSFSEGCAWLEMGDGKRYYPPTVRNLRSRWLAPSRVDPATDSDILLTFDIPPKAQPVMLILCLRLGDIDPNAQWNLTLS